MAKDIPYCPLMSAGSEIDKVCTLESCAWYVPSIKKCAVYMLGFNALYDLNIKQKTLQKKLQKK